MIPVSRRLLLQLGWLLVLAGQTEAAEDLAPRTWIVEGVTREALVRIPTAARKGGAPIVFVFHGHGGSMKQAAASMPIHQHWPEAIVVYPQGLPTPSPLVDREGRRTGWQGAAGDQGDRDLKFFDAIFGGLKGECHFDERRVYVTGHSNGGAFTYLLWAQRGEKIAATAPSAAVMGRGFRDLAPKPVLHIGSPQDELVKFSWQERMIDEVLRLNGCGPRKSTAPGYTTYASSKGAETATFLHAGGHRYSSAAPELIVKFFQAHPAGS